MSKSNFLDIKTERRNQFIEITSRVQKLISEWDVKEGLAFLYVPHTTAAITINENADPSVKSDILGQLEKMVPRNGRFEHSEGNSDAHIKATLTGFNAIIPISDGRILLGTWQGIYFCEYDGPRSRRLVVKIIPG